MTHADAWDAIYTKLRRHMPGEVSAADCSAIAEELALCWAATAELAELRGGELAYAFLAGYLLAGGHLVNRAEL